MAKTTTLRKRVYNHQAPAALIHSSQVITDQAVSDASALPTPNPLVVEAICDMLMTQQPNVKRPPEKAAALLALIVELYKTNTPFPSRMAVALKLDCSVFTVDAALSTRLEEGYLTQIVETTTGKVRNRHSIVRHRFYKPSAELVDIATRAGKKRRAA